MKRLITFAVLLAALGVGVGQTFAAADPPKVPPMGTEGPDIRLTQDDRSTQPIKGNEGPNTR